MLWAESQYIARHRNFDHYLAMTISLVLFSGNQCKKTKHQQLEVESLLAHVLAYDHQTLLDALRRGRGECSKGSGSLIPASSAGKGWSEKTGVKWVTPFQLSGERHRDKSAWEGFLAGRTLVNQRLHFPFPVIMFCVAVCVLICLCWFPPGHKHGADQLYWSLWRTCHFCPATGIPLGSPMTSQVKQVGGGNSQKRMKATDVSC